VAFSGAMIGRAAECGVLDRLVGGVAAGAGATVLVEGEAGIGKTRLLRSAIESAHERRVQVMVGTARPFEGTRPFGALAEALHLRRGSSDPRRAAIAQLLSSDGTHHHLASPGSPPDVRYRVVDEIVDLVEALAADVPLLVALEDLHWADVSTILAFRSMMDRLAHMPALLVGTLRPSPRPTELDLLLDDVEASGATFLGLEPLAPSDVDELVHAEIGLPAGPDLGQVISQAGGNPLWVVEILRSLSADGRLDLEGGSAEVTTAGLPHSFRQLVLRRLRYLPDATLAVLRVAAVLGDAFSLVDLATVTGRRALDLLEELAPALQARLLHEQGTTLMFRHQLVHDAIYEDIPQAGRVALHREAARVLADAGAPLPQIAAHVLRGAVPGDVQAVRWLRAAARDALPGAPDVAIDILGLAETLLPLGHPDRDVVTAELVEALLRGGQIAECAARAEAVLARPGHSEAEASLWLSLVSALSLQNRASELIVQTEAALNTTLGLSLTDRALILAQASYGRTFSGDLSGGEHTARNALELAQRSGDVGMTVWSLTTLSFAVKTQGRCGEAVDLTKTAVRLALEPPEEQARLRHPHFFLGMALCDADRMAEAHDAYRHGMRECAELGSSWILPDIQLLLGELHFLTGEWDDALAELEGGLAAAAERGNRVAVAQSLGYRALASAARGDRNAAHAALAPLKAELAGSSPCYGAEIAAYALSFLAEADGQPVTAFELLRRFWQLDADRQTRRYHRYLAPALVRLALTLEQPEVVPEVLDAAEEAAALAPEVPSVRGAALRCRGLIKRDPELMLGAVELVRAGPRVLDHVGTCEDAAAVLASVGQTTAAQSLLVEALTRHEQLAATPWAARVRAALRHLGVRQGIRGPRRRPATGWESLTETERVVAQLVAEGLTNREVSGRLYISPNTVNTHLRHLFQKLGVSSRAGLAAATVHNRERLT
jgi:DNA-binding CsgD family transcriptional regulator